MSETRFCPMIKDHCKNDLCIAWAQSECSYFSYYSRPRPRMAKPAGDWKTNDSNSGLAWSQDEDAALVKMFESGKKVSDLSQIHKRTEYAINMRLERLGKIQPAEQKSAAAK